MQFAKIIFMFLFISPLFYSCGGDGGGSDSPDEEVGGTPDGPTTGGGGSGGGTSTANFDVVRDSSLTGAERSALNSSIEALERFKIDGSQIAGFSKVFGGNRSSNVVSFLERRVNYVISEFIDYNSRLQISEMTPQPELPSSNFFAQNPSVEFWYRDRYSSDQGGARYVINGNAREINSSRIGVVQLGDLFRNSDSAVRAITLVHEARHSDCPNGALLSDIIGFVEGNLQPKDLSCGQFHNGGDVVPWGAYAVDYIYSLAIFRTCTNCTETQKLEAMGNANQVQGAAYDINGTLNNNYGNPNMGTSTRVRNDL